MITRESFTDTHIRELQNHYHRDPILLERAVYAFGLLEALSKVGLPFIFKGGTCLMLLLKTPRRLSTDIDIIVEPGTDVDEYISRASEIFPFTKKEEVIRKGKNNIEKRHFRFSYDSPVNGKPFYILLDILFEENHYCKVLDKEIKMDMLLSEGEPLRVQVPSIDCILGDKMTAFAPNTTGIPLRANKDMEVIKQMYDISSLIDEFSNYAHVTKSYLDVCKAEIAYRGTTITAKDCLIDTFLAAACIAGRAQITPEDYPVYVKGIHDFRDHVLVENFSAEVAATRAPKIMYLAMCLFTETPFLSVENPREYTDKQIQCTKLKPLKYLRKVDPVAYAYTIKAEELYLSI